MDDPAGDHWARLAAGVLRRAGRLGDDEPDAAAWDALTTDTLAGVALRPLGLPEDLDGLPATDRRGGRGPWPPGGWDVRAWHVGPTAEATSVQALADLEGGATSLWLTLVEGGLAPADLPAALDGVRLDAAPVVLDCPDDPLGAARSMVAHLGSVRAAAGTSLGVDPLGHAVRRWTPARDDLADTVRTAADLAASAKVRGLVVDASAVHEQGGAEHLELGYALAAGTAYLRILVDAGLAVEEALATMDFRFAATDDVLLTVAKLRAARRVWARVGEICGAGGPTMRQHAVTSRPMVTRYDPWVNLVRGTVAAFAAGVGGADAVTVLPYDAALGLPSALGRRLARTTSAVLLAEAGIGGVADPAGGAYAVEAASDGLARAGWEAFDGLEREGGVVDALAGGLLEGLVGDSRAARATRVRTGRRPVTGVSTYPLVGEALPVRKPYPVGLALPPSWAAELEAMRDAPRGPVLLVTLGPPARHARRSGTARDLLASGGVVLVESGPVSGVGEVLAAYAGERVVVLSGDDASYAEQGAAVAGALRAAGVGRVVAVDAPTASAGGWADDTCSEGGDAVAFLRRVREALA